MRQDAMEMDEYHGKNGVLDDVSEVNDVKKQYNDMMDRIDMDRLGKKQELKRNFRLISIFSFMCVAMSTWVFVIKYGAVFDRTSDVADSRPAHRHLDWQLAVPEASLLSTSPALSSTSRSFYH